MSTDPKIGDLRVWWIPQIPGKPFHVPVASLEEADKIMETLARYDQFQFDNNIKPDYCNVGGLEVFEGDDGGEDDRLGWCEWCDEETGDSIENFRRNRRETI